MAGGVSIGPRIQVDGEEQYRQQIRGIIEQSKTLDAEMRALTATFTDETSAQEKARQSQYNLNEQLDLARERTRLVREMTQKAAEATEENSTETLKWRQALANAEEQQAKLERAVEENNRALEDQDKAMEDAEETSVGFGDGLDSIAGKLGIQIPDAAKNALNGVSGFSAGTVAAMTGAAAAIAAAYKIGKELFDLTREAAAKADALLTRSAQTGLDTSTLQGLDYASRFLDFEGLDKTLVKFTQSMAAANEGTKAQAEAFERLGISVTDVDGNLLNNYDTFLLAIDALGQIENATERDALANDLFGKSYADMKPLIDAGTESLQAYIDEANRLGYVIDEEVVRKLGALDDAVQKNEASTDALKTKFAGELAPTFTLLTDAATGVQDAIGRILDDETSKRWAEFGIAMTGPLGDGIIRFKALADAIQNFREKHGQSAEAAEEDGEKMAEAVAKATESATADIGALREAYNGAYDAAKKSLDGQFGLWEQAGEVTATSTADMLAGLQSQIDYWNEYESNFNSLVSRNIEGIEEFAKNFDDGSLASAQALAGLKDATDEEIRQIIEKMGETNQAKENIAGTFAALGTDVSGSLDKIKEDYAATVTEINTKTGEIDFAPFDAAVEAAFGGMETRAATAAETAVATVQAAIDTINSMEINPIVEQSTQWSDEGHNAAGTDFWRGGVTWVGEDGPEKVWLPRGTQIFSNQESRQMAAAATDTRAMEGLLGQVLTALEQIRAENQAQNMRRRMA